MIWQDIAITVGCFILAGALVPTIRNKHKPEPLTSALTGGVLAVFAFAFATLGLWLSAVSQALCALLWLVLLAQVLIIKRRK